MDRNQLEVLRALPVQHPARADEEWGPCIHALLSPRCRHDLFGEVSGCHCQHREREIFREVFELVIYRFGFRLGVREDCRMWHRADFASGSHESKRTALHSRAKRQDNQFLSGFAAYVFRAPSGI